jgi:hypothetical protein
MRAAAVAGVASHQAVFLYTDTCSLMEAAAGADFYVDAFFAGAADPHVAAGAACSEAYDATIPAGVAYLHDAATAVATTAAAVFPASASAI